MFLQVELLEEAGPCAARHTQYKTVWQTLPNMMLMTWKGPGKTRLKLGGCRNGRVLGWLQERTDQELAQALQREALPTPIPLPLAWAHPPAPMRQSPHPDTSGGWNFAADAPSPSPARVRAFAATSWDVANLPHFHKSFTTDIPLVSIGER